MKPDEKYMSEVKIKNKNTSFTFTPPSFNRSLISSLNRNTNEENNNFLDLYPDQTERSELYCYYSISGNCDEKNTQDNNKNSKRLPTPFEVLRSLNLNYEETLKSSENDEDINKIYLELKSKNPDIYETFIKFNIPVPICKVLIKSIIKLTLQYQNKK